MTVVVVFGTIIGQTFPFSALNINNNDKPLLQVISLLSILPWLCLFYVYYTISVMGGGGGGGGE